jgi:hypothetical protein
MSHILRDDALISVNNGTYGILRNPDGRNKVDTALLKSLVTSLPTSIQRSDFDIVVNESTVQGGSTVVGTVHFKHQSPQYGTLPIKLTLQGFEFAMVNERKMMRGHHDRRTQFDPDYLLQHQSQHKVILNKDVTLTPSQTAPKTFLFSVDLPWEAAPTLRNIQQNYDIFHDAYGILIPNQCEIKYLLSAHIPKTTLTGHYTLTILPKSTGNLPTTRQFEISLGKPRQTYRSYFCGLWNVPTTTYDLTTKEQALTIYPGQALEINFEDQQRLGFNASRPILRLTQKISWTARGRHTQDSETCEFLDRCTVPTNLFTSYRGTLVQVEHTLIVYCKDLSSGEYLAITVVLPVQVVQK